MKDLTIQSIQENEGDIWDSNLYSFRYLPGKEIGRGFGIYAGPSLSLLISDEEDERDYTWYSILDANRSDHNFKFWIDFSAGIQFF